MIYQDNFYPHPRHSLVDKNSPLGTQLSRSAWLNIDNSIRKQE
jgi:hypothetical protein